MHAKFVLSRLRRSAAVFPMRKAAFVALFAAAIASAPAAHAQFSSLSLPTLTEATSGENGPMIAGSVGKNGIFSLGFYPYAPFQFNASVKSFPIQVTEANQTTGAVSSVQASIPSTSASFTASGVLFAPEYVYTLKNQRSGIGIGGWYWLHDQNKSEDYSGKFDADLYDIHAKYFFTPKLALEVGYLGQTNSSIPAQEGVNGYVSYAFGTNNAAKKGSFGVTTGLGVQDVAGTSVNISEPQSAGTVYETFDFKQTTDFAAYVSGSYYVIPHGSINLSYWLLTGSQTVDVSATESGISDTGATVFGSGSTSQSRTVSRFGIGFGYQF